MKCLSLRQPWLWAVLHAGKDVENRTWHRSVRGPVLLHAAKGCTRAEYESGIATVWDLNPLAARQAPPLDAMQRGGICGIATFTGRVLRPTASATESPWHFPEQFGYVLADVRPLPFIPWRGELGFFEVNLSQLAHVDAAYAALTRPA